MLVVPETCMELKGRDGVVVPGCMARLSKCSPSIFQKWCVLRYEGLGHRDMFIQRSLVSFTMISHHVTRIFQPDGKISSKANPGLCLSVQSDILETVLKENDHLLEIPQPPEPALSLRPVCALGTPSQTSTHESQVSSCQDPTPTFQTWVYDPTESAVVVASNGASAD